MRNGAKINELIRLFRRRSQPVAVQTTTARDRSSPGCAASSPCYLGPRVYWNRLLAVVFLGAALLLLRTGATERAEIPDAGNAVESVFSDDATDPAAHATVEPA